MVKVLCIVVLCIAFIVWSQCQYTQNSRIVENVTVNFVSYNTSNKFLITTTTQSPSTSNPTTSNPTTAIPTTAITTTAIPTTSNPTSSVPTTSVPTIMTKNTTSTMSDKLSLTLNQSMINSYINRLSKGSYSEVKKKVIIKRKFIKVTFPHLTVDHMISAFRNKNVWIAGDSTIENLFNYIMWIFDEYNSTKNNSLMLINRRQYKSTLRFNYELTLIRGPFPSFPKIKNSYPYNENNSYYKTMLIKTSNDRAWGIIYRYFEKYNINIYGGKWQECGYYPSPEIIDRLPVPIDIMITNLALMFCLHLIRPFGTGRGAYSPHKRFRPSDFWKLNELQSNIELENKLEIFVNNSINQGVKCLIIYGSNTIVDETYYGGWKQIVDLWSPKVLNKTLLDICFRTINATKYTIYGPDDIVLDLSDTTGFTMTAYELCKNYPLLRIGSYWTSQRVYLWIKWKQKQLDMMNNGNNPYKFKLFYFNQTQITDGRIKYTKDGRHYHKLVPVKTEAITNIISNFCR